MVKDGEPRRVPWSLLSYTPLVPPLMLTQWKAAEASHYSSWYKIVQN